MDNNLDLMNLAAYCEKAKAHMAEANRYLDLVQAALNQKQREEPVPHSPRLLTTMLGEADTLLKGGDPGSAATILRIICEHMVRCIVQANGLWDKASAVQGRTPTYSSCLTQLREHQLLDKSELLLFNQARLLGNAAAHDSESNPKIVEALLEETRDYAENVFLPAYPECASLGVLPENNHSGAKA